MKDTPLRNSEQLGAFMRLRRKEKGISQEKLAKAIGVERKWVSRLEAGNRSAELGLVLRALSALDLLAYAGDAAADRARRANSPLAEVFRRLERARER